MILTISKAAVLCRFGLALTLCTACVAQPLSEDEAPPETPSNQPWFLFDKADEIVPGTSLENPLFYDAGIAPGSNGLWLAWLEFVPGKGDQLWVGQHGKDGWLSKQQLTTVAGDYANPTPTVDAQGQLWLTYETTNAQGTWHIYARRRRPNGDFEPPVAVSQGSGPSICHRVAPDHKSGICVAWQGSAG